MKKVVSQRFVVDGNENQIVLVSRDQDGELVFKASLTVENNPAALPSFGRSQFHWEGDDIQLQNVIYLLTDNVSGLLPNFVVRK